MKQEFVTLQREAVEQAITALESDEEMATAFHIEISELRAALEQPQVEQEPFLWLDPNFGDIWDKDAIARDEKPDGLLPLYTNPQPPRQPLMEEEICKLMVSGDYLTVKGLTKFVRDIELAHGIKEQK